MAYLLDTNIFIKAFVNSQAEKKMLFQTIKSNKLHISAIVVAEFLARANSKEKAKFRRLMNRFDVILIDRDVAIQASKYRHQLSVKSKRTIMLDCFIAAQAKLYNLTLVTNNKADFPMRDIKVITP